MHKKRIIFTLLYDDGFFMLSRNFRLQKVGDLQWLKKNYNFSHIAFSIDELIILDVTRGERNEDKFYDCVKSLSEECFIPIAAGGGIRTLEQGRKLLFFGADKVVLNYLVIKNPDIVSEIAKEFGQQSIVASVDVKITGQEFTTWIDNGGVKCEQNLPKILNNIESLPIGELYLNSIDRDGTGNGFQIELLDCVPNLFPIPVILAGGAGKYMHFSEALKDARVDAVATAHLFNFIGDGLEENRNKLINENFDLVKWNVNLVTNLRKCL